MSKEARRGTTLNLQSARHNYHLGDQIQFPELRWPHLLKASPNMVRLGQAHLFVRLLPP